MWEITSIHAKLVAPNLRLDQPNMVQRIAEAEREAIKLQVMRILQDIINELMEGYVPFEVLKARLISVLAIICDKHLEGNSEICDLLTTINKILRRLYDMPVPMIKLIKQLKGKMKMSKLSLGQLNFAMATSSEMTLNQVLAGGSLFDELFAVAHKIGSGRKKHGASFQPVDRWGIRETNTEKLVNRLPKGEIHFRHDFSGEVAKGAAAVGNEKEKKSRRKLSPR